jgi:DNA-binding MarR family transcriptional regulator
MIDDAAEALRASLFGNVFVLGQHLTRRTDEALQDWGLTSRQWLLLAVLTRGFPGRAPSLSEAAQAYASSRQNVKQIALGLQARGFLRLVPDPLDARTTRLQLTQKVRLFDTPDGQTRARALLDGVFESLTAEDISTMHDLVGRWLATLSAGSAGRPDHAPRERTS